MSRTLTDLVTELGQAAQICSGFAVRTTAHTAADALTQVYEAALRGLHQLQVERRKLELERQQAAAREQSIVDDQARNASIIKLNVGGVLFVTTRSTLCRPGSYFEAMFSGRHALAQVDGAYYLDRSGRVFEGVMDFLRTGIVHPPPEISFEQLMCELDYFLLIERRGRGEASASMAGGRDRVPKVPRRTPSVDELLVGTTVWVKEHQETLYNYPRTARNHFGSQATVSDLFFAGNSMQQIGISFDDGFTYYFCCRDIEVEDNTLDQLADDT
jgi:hypothetical protein